MRMWIFSIHIILLLFFSDCQGATDELTPKQSCYKRRENILYESPFSPPCKIYTILKVVDENALPEKKAKPGSPSSNILNLNLLYCLYEVQSRIDCEKLGY